MKKTIMIGLVLGLFVFIGAAHALPIQLHVGTYGDDDGWTGSFNEMQFFANTTTTQYGPVGPNGTPAVGSTFSDDGNLNVSSFTGLVGDDEGLGVAGSTGTAYALTGSWTGLTGTIVGETFIPIINNYLQVTAYDSGTVIDIYLDDDVDQNFGPTVAAGDDTNFANGDVVVGQITIRSGTGTNLFDAAGNFITGSSKIFAEFTSMTPDFWFTVGGVDLYDVLVVLNMNVTVDIDQNTNHVVLNTAGLPTGALFQVYSDHDGSIEVAVPEPASMFLVGTGLLGLAGFGRRRFAKK